MDSKNDMRQDIRTPVHENRDLTSHRCLTFGARQSLHRNGLVCVTGNVYHGMYISSQVYHRSLIVAPANLGNCDGRMLHDSSFSVGKFHQTESIGHASQFTAGNGRGVERGKYRSYTSCGNTGLINGLENSHRYTIIFVICVCGTNTTFLPTWNSVSSSHGGYTATGHHRVTQY